MTGKSRGALDRVYLDSSLKQRNWDKIFLHFFLHYSALPLFRWLHPLSLSPAGRNFPIIIYKILFVSYSLKLGHVIILIMVARERGSSGSNLDSQTTYLESVGESPLTEGMNNGREIDH